MPFPPALLLVFFLRTVGGDRAAGSRCPILVDRNGFELPGAVGGGSENADETVPFGQHGQKHVLAVLVSTSGYPLSCWISPCRRTGAISTWRHELTRFRQVPMNLLLAVAPTQKCTICSKTQPVRKKQKSDRKTRDSLWPLPTAESTLHAGPSSE